MAVFLRKYGTGTGSDVWIPIIKRGVVDFALSADWTPAAGDVVVTKDGAAAGNIGTLPTALTMGNTAVWKFVFSDAELQCKVLTVTVADAATKAVEDQCFIIHTYGNASAMYLIDYKDAVRFGLTALPNAAAGAAGGLPTGDASARVQVQYGTAAGQINLSGGNLAGAVPSVTGAVGSVTSVSTGAITSTSFAADSISSAAFSQAAADKAWSTAARTLTAGTNIVLAKGTGVTGFNDITAASVWGVARSGNQGVGSFGEYVDAAISTRSVYAGGAVASVTGNVGGNVVGSVGSVATGGITATSFASDAIDAGAFAQAAADKVWSTATRSVTDKAGYALSAAGLDTVAVESGVNPRQALSVILASTAGVLSGCGTGTISIKAGNNPATERISATIDGSNNRTAVTLTLPT